MIDPASVVRHLLPNGLRVLVRRDDSAPVASVVTYVMAGYFDETDDQVGIAHVLEHMFFKGTPTRGVGAMARETKASGGYLNAHTIYDHTSYYAVLPADGFARGLEIQADAYVNSLIDADELARELEVIIQEAKRKEDTPSAIAVESLYELLHDHHRIRRWRIGREAGLRAFTRDRLLGFYRNYYRPSNTILAIVGDVDLDATLRQVERLYGGVPAGALVRNAGSSETVLPGVRYRDLSGDIGQAHVAFGWRTPGVLDPDTALLDLAAPVLGDGRASRLYRAVRERQLASSVSATNYTPADIGVFLVRTEGPPDRAREAAQATWGELARLHAHGLADDELERTRRLFEARWLRQFETMDGQANWLAGWESLGDWTLGGAYHERLMTASRREVEDAVRRHLDPAQVSLLVYRPASAEPVAADEAAARQLLAPRATAGSAPAAGALPAGTPVRPAAARLVRRVGAVAEFRTGRGVPVLVRRKQGTPFIDFGVYLAEGGAAEPDAMAGLATLLTRVAAKGTATRTANEIATASEMLGGSIASRVTSDGLGWTLSVPARHFAAAAELLADVVQEPTFQPEAIDTERAVALSQLAQLRDDMYRYPQRLAFQAAWAPHPYGRGLLGSEESLGCVTPDAVRAWHAERVRRAPVVIAACGDADEAEMAAMLAGAFGRLEPRDTQPLAPPAWPAGGRSAVEERARNQTALAIAFPSSARRDVARHAAGLLASVASGLGGRFFEALREERSLAYTVQAYAGERAAAGVFMAYIATSPAQEDEARTGLLAEFRKLSETEVTPDELSRAKAYTLGSHDIAQQSGGNVLSELVDAWLMGEGLEELGAFRGRVQAVTAREMLALARSHFDVDRRVEGIVRGTAPAARA